MLRLYAPRVTRGIVPANLEAIRTSNTTSSTPPFYAENFDGQLSLAPFLFPQQVISIFAEIRLETRPEKNVFISRYSTPEMQPQEHWHTHGTRSSCDFGYNVHTEYAPSSHVSSSLSISVRANRQSACCRYPSSNPPSSQRQGRLIGAVHRSVVSVNGVRIHILRSCQQTD